jgi:hypothetical protein
MGARVGIPSGPPAAARAECDERAREIIRLLLDGRAAEIPAHASDAVWERMFADGKAQGYPTTALSRCPAPGACEPWPSKSTR